MRTHYKAGRLAVRAARGFTLIELMVTVAIALFLIGGLMTVLQNVRSAYNSQQALSQLQDEQRFALTVLTDVIQAGGFFPDPVNWQPLNSLPASGNFVTAGQAFWGTRPGGGAADTISIRYRTAANDGVILCDGSSNQIANPPTELYINQFSVVLPVGNTPGQLQCTLTNATSGAVNAPVTIVNGVQNLQVIYGVKRTAVPADYNVDTYLTADQMLAADWANVSSVRVILTFTNPLFGQPGQAANQPAQIIFERVIEVMSRAGFHS